MNKSSKITIVIAILFIMGMFAFGYISNKSENQNTASVINVVNPDTPLGIQTGNAPWQPEIKYLKERLSAISLPALTEEGSAVHTHQHLDIFIDGKSIAVPAEIGVNEIENFISPIHTHDYTAVIHIESPTIQKFYLGQFFDIWGVKFNQNCIGGYCVNGQKTLKIYTNGKLTNGNPRDLELLPYQEIVIVYGTATDTPTSIPSTYDFDSNL